MTRATPAIILALAAIALGAASASAQKVYKWTDANGKIHFSNVAPVGEATSDDASGVTGVEARNPDAPSAEAPASPPEAVAVVEDAPKVEGEASKPEISDELFSARASATRSRLKREMAQAKEQQRAADDKLAAIKKQREDSANVGLEMLQRAYGTGPQESNLEDEARKEKHKADQKIEALRKEYTELHDEAVKRLGHKPGWWLPIE